MSLYMKRGGAHKVCMILTLCRVAITALLFSGHLCLYNSLYGLCRLEKIIMTHKTGSIPLQGLHGQRVPQYPFLHHSNPTIKNQSPLQYRNVDFYYHSKLGQGGASEVFLVEQISTGKLKVAKRYRHNRKHQLQATNFILSMIKQPLVWAREDSEESKVAQKADFASVAVFPYRQAVTLDQLQFDAFEAPLILYKLLRQLQCLHSQGVVHNDIKPGNIIIISKGKNYQFYEVQLIDWDRAQVYYTGKQQSLRKSTKCFMPPQAILGTHFGTPAADIWSLGITIYFYHTGALPFRHNCFQYPLTSMVSLYGSLQILFIYEKYRMSSPKLYHLISQLQRGQVKDNKIDLGTFKPDLNALNLEQQFTDVLGKMLELDPSKRATATQLLRMPYFQSIVTLPQLGQENSLQQQQRKGSKEKI